MLYICLITKLAFVFAKHKISLVERKPVFRICDHVMHKQAYSDYSTVARILKFWLAASGVKILFRERHDQSAYQTGCTGWSVPSTCNSQVFSH